MDLNTTEPMIMDDVGNEIRGLMIVTTNHFVLSWMDRGKSWPLPQSKYLTLFAIRGSDVFQSPVSGR